MKRIILFEKDTYSEYPFIDQLNFSDTMVQLEGDIVTFHAEDGKIQQIVPQKIYTHKNDRFLLLSEDSMSFAKNTSDILIGQRQTDIVIPKGRYVIAGTKLIAESGSNVYVNGKRQLEDTIPFAYGDHILLEYCYLCIVHETFIELQAPKESYACTLCYYQEKKHRVEGFPEYKRSPRIIKRLKNDKITIVKPPAKISRKKNSLVKVIVPPLVMGCGTVAMSLMMGRGLYMLIGLAGTLVSLVFSVTAYFSDKKELKEKKARREEVYETYLLDMRKKLNRYQREEMEALQYNHPNLNELEDMVMQYSPRIYEKDVNDDDFLNISVGKADHQSEYQITLDYDALETEKDELLEDAKAVYRDYHIIKNKPMVIDLKKAHLGIVGERHEIHEQLKWFLAQITFFHSYHDVQIVMLYHDAYKEEFEYSKWYPHMKILANNLTGNIHSERVRDQVFGSLHQILKDRKLKRDENKKEMSFLPHFIIVVDDPHLVVNHSIMEYLQEPATELGFTLIYTAQKRANLPENIKTVVTMEDLDTATLLLNEGVEINKRYHVQRIQEVNLERMARDLSVLEHMQGVTSHIPESITFFQMYHVASPQELNIEGRWQKGESHKSLAVPIGVRAVDDFVELNLHEKAHGPHGLVAGTTGSGKSETIQTYILSLAVNFSPYEVGFLLIDYKGGGMANLFKKLPHLLGTITNLDGAESMRALASIKAELARRQRIFNANSVNNINNYNKLFKSGKAKEPLPHLFIISDEFAELKKEQPEFMSELVSVARIGRTLGVHLILATQKPTGVVDDQIWSNSKFKLALKVQDESDSKEIIKTPDAAFITQTGRGYLQVGNNEIYELFQSAWSGAIYTTSEEQVKVDDRIYKINVLGQGELINQDLSEDSSQGESMTTQLDAIVNHIEEVYTQGTYLEVAKPWLPSLPTYLPSPYIQTIDFQDTSRVKAIDLTCPIGLVDIPEEQTQKDYAVDFKKDGNLAIFSSSGYGKSTTMGSILLTLAMKNNPMLLHCYLLDFGNSSLIPFKSLPHVADYLTFDSVEKIDKFQRILTEEIKTRKQLFAREMVQNFTMYNQLHVQEPMKAMMLMIDNFDVVKEISMDFEDFIMKTTRDGNGLGIYTVISATRANAVRFATLNNFKNKIVQYMFDDGDVMSLIGRSPYKLSEIKGRALVKQKAISMMQVYAPVASEDEVEFITHLKAVIQDIANRYTGAKVLGIPVLPDIFTTDDFSKYKCEDVKHTLIGLSMDNVENVSLAKVESPYVILGPAKSGKTNFLEVLLEQGTGNRYIFDSDALSLYKYKGKEDVHYVNNEADVTEFVERLFTETEKRRQDLEQVLADGEFESPKQYYASLPAFSIFIDDADSFVQKVQNIPKIGSLLEQAAQTGIRIYVAANSSKLKGFDEVTKFFKGTTSGAVLGNMGTLSLFPVNMRDLPQFGNAVLCNNGELRKVKLPKSVGL